MYEGMKNHVFLSAINEMFLIPDGAFHPKFSGVFLPSQPRLQLNPKLRIFKGEILAPSFSITLKSQRHLYQ